MNSHLKSESDNKDEEDDEEVLDRPLLGDGEPHGGEELEYAGRARKTDLPPAAANLPLARSILFNLPAAAAKSSWATKLSLSLVAVVIGFVVVRSFLVRSSLVRNTGSDSSGGYEDRFLISTPQRSGSHFLTSLLRHSGVECIGELQFPLDRKKLRALPFSEYITLFSEALDSAKCGILHQSHFHDSALFANFLVANRIKVISGTRSAIMVISDIQLREAADAEFGTHVSGPKVPTINQKYFNLTAHHLLVSNGKLASQVGDLERQQQLWERQHLEPLQSHRLAFKYEYEALLMSERVAHFALVLHFVLGGSSSAELVTRSAAAFEREALGAPVTLHPPTCASRVDDWRDFRRRINGTRCAAVCDALGEFFGR